MARPSIDPRLWAAIRPIARRYGIDPLLLAATAYVESGGRLNAVGDSGTSFGPYQMHRGGRLTAAGYTPRQAMDPVLATEATAREFADFAKRGYRGAELAYAAQRPANREDYIRKINQALSMFGGAAPAMAAPAAAPTPSAPGAQLAMSLGPPRVSRDLVRAFVLQHGTEGLSRMLPQMVTREPIMTPMTPASAPENAPPLPAPPAAPTSSGPVAFAAAPDYRWAQELANRFGVSVSSTYRDPARNRSVGGSRTSRHMTRGAAVDFSGSPEAMRRLAEWAGRSGLFAEVFYDPWGQWDNGRYLPRGIGGHSDHVHISLGAPALPYFYRGRR